MYTVTFYSFKGGVGRTMALVNVAVDLVRRGRRVLVVDFDLEAPGLDTFDALQTRGRIPGIVDYVSMYLSTGRSPHVEDFVFESKDLGTDESALWVMPSGAHGERYATSFAEIDWGNLYEQHDGYLFFEDLKAQWRDVVNPDYVLIDSRTGHTDVGGICTRQLPDAVVILFFPNAQNLRGLTRVVRDIRSERTEPSVDDIELHFVMSNVPDLDDEDKILEQSIRSFQHNLGFGEDPLMIHRYDSLSLLNQVIFTKDRRRSRLAREYGAVAAEIMRLNPKDRDGAVQYISEASRMMHTVGVPPRFRTDTDVHLKQIETNHKDDGEVLFRLGSWRAEEGRLDDAVSLLDSAIRAGNNKPEVFLQRAEIRRSENDRDGASKDAIEILQSPHATPPQVRRALTMIQPSEYALATGSPAFSSLSPDDRIWIASDFSRSRSAAETTRSMLEPLLKDTNLPRSTMTQARHEYILASIAVGSFPEAMNIALNEQPDVGKMSIYFAFNYGMAKWGLQRSLDREPFSRVISIARDEPEDDQSLNYLQCMAFAYSVIGDLDKARRAIESARVAMRSVHSSFSCWRYYHVSVDQLGRDLDEMSILIEGDTTMRPRFVEDNFPSGLPYTVQVPDGWPTHELPSDLCEEIGRTIATFGFLEYVIKRAILELSKPTKSINDSDYKEWERSLELTATTAMAKLTGKLGEVLEPDSRLSQVRVTRIVEVIKEKADLHNALCHGTWIQYDPASGDATLQYFPRNDPRHSQFVLSRAILARVRYETVEVAREVMGAVKWKVPGFPRPTHGKEE